MAAGVLALLMLLAAPPLSDAGRVNFGADLSGMGAATSFVPRAGLGVGRYQLVGRSRALAKVPRAPEPGSPAALNDSALLELWPHGVRGMSIRYGASPRQLGRGGFGDVWQAKDKLTGQEVAIKFFLDESPSDPSHEYLFFSSATWYQRSKLTEASVECQLSQSILAQAAIDPAGASHISACLENHIKPTKGEYSKQVAYLVLQPGGKELAHWRTKFAMSPPQDATMARKVMVQLLQGLRFLQKLSPPIIHHDLKPQNIVYEERDGELFIKLIDWGAAMTGTQESQDAAYCFTEYYKPPEASLSKSMDKPWWSYDVYSAGIIYLELLCPNASIVGIGKYLEGHRGPNLKPLMNSHDEQGQKNCPGMSPDDEAIITKMLRNSFQRPSPDELLSSAPLREWVNEEVREEDRPPKQAAVNSTEFLVHELNEMSGGRIHVADGTKKCCCNAKTGQCQLVDLAVPHPACSSSWLDWLQNPSCSCLVGEGWRSVRSLGAAQCIISTPEEDHDWPRFA